MAKAKTIFVCQECGSERPKWEGQCRDCGAWNTLVEEKQAKVVNPRGWQTERSSSELKSRPLNEIDETKNGAERRTTSISELDRVLGGGLVRGSFILLGGDPGIGKSTLLLQMAGGLAKTKAKVLYVSGEESVEQTALRARRLRINENCLHVASESSLENILSLVSKEKPEVLVVDSIQTVYLNELPSAPGTVSQVRESASRLLQLAKTEGITVILVGHITKDGSIAGPKTLEHMVDTVLLFEGDSSQQFRLLRAQKNRFGATNELGVFRMDSMGLEEVTNPSEMFLADRGDVLEGSVVFAGMEGTRPLLCEVQALATQSFLAMPRRTSVGFDVQRVHLLTAVLEKHLDVGLSKNDIFVNVVGGLKIQETAADLAVASALISTLNEKEIDSRMVFFGEIGLTGEIRAAPFAIERVREAEKLGFKHVVLPHASRPLFHKANIKLELELYFLKHVKELHHLDKLTKM
jgi:DNA repair protein RadA/Sms